MKHISFTLWMSSNDNIFAFVIPKQQYRKTILWILFSKCIWLFYLYVLIRKHLHIAIIWIWLALNVYLDQLNWFHLFTTLFIRCVQTKDSIQCLDSSSKYHILHRNHDCDYGIYVSEKHFAVLGSCCAIEIMFAILRFPWKMH